MTLLYMEDAHALEALHVTIDRRRPQALDTPFQDLGFDLARAGPFLLQLSTSDFRVMLFGCIGVVGGFLRRLLARFGLVVMRHAGDELPRSRQFLIGDLIEGFVSKNSGEKAGGRTDVRPGVPCPAFSGLFIRLFGSLEGPVALAARLNIGL
ncbi:hypothetical protein ACR034_06395 [Limimaricola litoreus]